MAAIIVNADDPQHAVVDLKAELNKVSGMDHGSSGRIAHPIISLPGLRAVVVSMKAGAKWDQHSTPGRITVQPLTGRIRMSWHNEHATLTTGNVLALAGNVPHDVVAEADSVFLLTVARPSAD